MRLQAWARTALDRVGVKGALLLVALLLLIAVTAMRMLAPHLDTRNEAASAFLTILESEDEEVVVAIASSACEAFITLLPVEGRIIYIQGRQATSENNGAICTSSPHERLTIRAVLDRP